MLKQNNTIEEINASQEVSLGWDMELIKNSAGKSNQMESDVVNVIEEEEGDVNAWKGETVEG